MKKFDPEYYRNQWNELNSLPSLVDAKTAVRNCCLSADKLEAYASAGYAPCVWIEGKAWYRQADVKAWIKNQVADFQAGKDVHIPKIIQIVNTNIEVGRKPPQLAVIDDLLELPIQTSDYPPAVYFLCLDREVVYVGQTINLILRVGEHSCDKIFDAVFFLPVPETSLLSVESEYIRQLQPIYNSTPINKRDQLNRELRKRLACLEEPQAENKEELTGNSNSSIVNRHSEIINEK